MKPRTNWKRRLEEGLEMRLPEGFALTEKGCIALTPESAWCSAHDAANMQMRKACRTSWSIEDYNLAVETQARLIRHLGYPFDEIARRMVSREELTGPSRRAEREDERAGRSP